MSAPDARNIPRSLGATTGRLARPVQPVEADAAQAPVKLVVITSGDLVAGGGIDQFPVTVTNPGTDVAAYFSCPVWITRDPQTGVYNAGTYRLMVKAPDRAGVMMLYGQDGLIHREKACALGRPLEALLCLSPPPAPALCSVTKLRQPGYQVAGGLNGAPLELVRVESVDLLNPAAAKIAIDGRFRTDVLEMEGPFGEYGGYAGPQDYQLIFEVSAITHRRSPILQAFISEMPPSECSCIRKFGFEGVLFLELAGKVPHLLGVNFFEIAGTSQVTAISLKGKPAPGEAWTALRAAASAVNMSGLKWVIAVDDGIDITDIESVLGRQPGGPAAPRHPDPPRPAHRPRPLCSPGRDTVHRPRLPRRTRRLADPHRRHQKWPYSPVSLPAREHMERAREIWDELGLPELTPRPPWFANELGFWPDA